ncbi:hypothetical protein Vadar_025834 [Vaccinium darrowii]|uniref:Uncharacterized protein n=1 Tax=Vaccinium darrowii TaxID=229202 RepID=A0ACB7YQT8_9ERIC|nr:hypothetical protein Vadar_025834 [Vaccinium darrowii]
MAGCPAPHSAVHGRNSSSGRPRPRADLSRVHSWAKVGFTRMKWAPLPSSVVESKLGPQLMFTPRKTFLRRSCIWFDSFKMEEGGVQGRYVKLTKEQPPVRTDIRPAELNEPIPAPQLRVRKCDACGQRLPESFEFPKDEPWSTGILGCAEDPESCWIGLLCPCVLCGRNCERINNGLYWTVPCMAHAFCVEGGIALAAAMAAFHGIDPYISAFLCEGLLFSWGICVICTGQSRLNLQWKYHLENSPCNPWMVHCCMHWCAMCQEHREMKGRLSEDVAMPMTVVTPPPVQEMNSATNDNNGTSPPSAKSTGHTSLEMQAL